MTTAHAPGSVTTVFAPGEGSDDAGSLGTSFTTADGVTATVEPAAETTVELDGEPTGFPPVEGVLRRLDATAAVSLSAEVPVGAGFGASGAATLATVLAADAEFGPNRDREALVTAAHRAEVEAGTGLGDVFVQARGGLVWNTGDGVGRAERTDAVSYATYGDRRTADVLGDADAMARVRRAADDAFEEFDPAGPLADLFDCSWTFADRTGLPSDRVREAVAAVERAGGAATMAMVGETVVGVGADDTLPETTRITTEGAALR
ncbi:GHMP family kinase ATP-binding protein [Candidatus Halobonum tyrrellensis]|uniref:Pantoate kinase n=1 Tax=Candidatus Halobonum tyrrellensis G22 TaxID=1324957 RepID=V4GU42_9EURY|nr:GHMP kinase ATP-binding protein [Candidatus Halobonum tyrrellensis]ESP88651.1 GHMP kinases ATP-binding protein [Candidatus Halobonum tyrrellensis G22]